MNHTLAPRSLLRMGAAAALLSITAIAQTTGSGTGSASNQAIDTFTQEVTVPFTSIGFATTPTIPASVLQTIQGGALEIRHMVMYNASDNSLNVRTFLVQPGAPNPTPSASQTNLVESYIVDVQSATLSFRPGRALTLMGTVRSMQTVSPFGDYTGAPFIYSFGYTPSATSTTGATTIASTAVTIPGLVSFYAPSSSGTLVFRAGGTGTGTGSTGAGTGTGTGTGGAGTGTGTGTGTGSTGTGTGTGTGTTTPPANRPPVANAGTNFQTVVSQVTLNASASTDPDGDTLIYSWRSVSRSASISAATSPTPIVQLGEGFGDYIFEVTVTDSKGASSTAQVTVTRFGSRL